MLEGLYSVTFRSSVGGSGSGVVFYRDGKAYGGDASHFYVGPFNVSGDRLVGNLSVSRHQPGESIFGDQRDFTLNLSGQVRDGGRLSLTGNVTGQPNLTIRIDGHRIADV